MLTVEAIEDFLFVVREDHARKNRLAAITTLTYLPLSIDAWRAQATVTGNFLRDLGPTGLDYK